MKGGLFMITYRNANKDDLKQIAQVHLACFSEYFLSSLGNDLLEKYYGEYFNEKSPFIVATNDSQGIIGFCMGYLTGTKARANFESKYKWKLSMRLLALCIKLDKRALTRVFDKIKSILKSFKSKNSQKTPDKKVAAITGDLLSICVLDDFKGTDVASTLVKTFENELKSRDISKYYLTVFKSNLRARAFYEKLGFKISKDKNTELIYEKDLH